MKKKAFESVYAQLEDIDGQAVVFGLRGEPSVIFEMQNPVQQLCTDASQYADFHALLSNIMQTVGEGYCIQKQDIFCRDHFHHPAVDDISAPFLTRSYFRYFEGRECVRTRTYLILTQEPVAGRFVQYNPRLWDEFLTKAAKVRDILSDKGIRYHQLDKREIEVYAHRFMAFDFRERPFAISNFKASDEYLRVGDSCVRSIQLVDIDEINLPGYVKPYIQTDVNGYPVATDVLAFLPEIPHAACVVYNQVMQIPHQRRLLRRLQAKSKRHASMPDPSNRIAKADIDTVLDRLAADSALLVYANFNLIVAAPYDRIDTAASFVETKLFESGIMPSRSAYNQLELFRSCFPGAGYSFNDGYDLFLTLGEAAICLMYKEHMRRSEDTPLKTYYTDRRGLPVCIDITGKEGSDRKTDNANFFCLGPSGSGKSFHMNSVVRQLIEQDTDVVIVDRGDSYEGLNAYYKGAYIAYSKDKPITMNPFAITREEYELNFGEKKDFLKSLVFLLFKGSEAPARIEELIVNQTIVEYYEAYFSPFKGFSDAERDTLRQKLLTAAKMEADYEAFEVSMAKIDEQIRLPETEAPVGLIPAAEVRSHKLMRQCRALYALVRDEAAAESERRVAAEKLEAFKDELYHSRTLAKIDKQIAHLEQQKLRLRVRGLSFNSYYEFAIERIPQILRFEKIDFDIRNFAALLKPYYRGGEYEHTLNSSMDVNLFDEKFIVFEVDKIDSALFPIIVLIIMDVFVQKMRIKKGRKALIIEEAWKAIATPNMAEYIKYLYKTVRKFHGIVGVVTQELGDVIDSPIVKEAIINNSDVKILLDQTKFKDRFDDIGRILGLTQVQKQQIFTVNALNNRDGRGFFKEVWISRGLHSDVYGVEEAPECYWAYTTERLEKEALKIYISHYGDIERAINEIERDRHAAGALRYLDFARQVVTHKQVKTLWHEDS